MGGKEGEREGGRLLKRIGSLDALSWRAPVGNADALAAAIGPWSIGSLWKLYTTLQMKSVFLLVSTVE